MSDATPDPAVAEAVSNTDRFYTQVKSLHGFDSAEVRSVIDTLLSKTEGERCHQATYTRVQGNIESLLLLEQSKHVQAIAMLARALFELAVDGRLLEILPNGWLKMTAHAEVAKLHLAERIIRFKAANPGVMTDTTVYEDYIGAHAARIRAVQKSLWPNVRKVPHWSGRTLAERCAFLKAPFSIKCTPKTTPRISWYTHPGLTGVANISFVTLIHVCAYGFHLAVRSYEQSLRTAIRVFRLKMGNEHIEARLDAALKFPFTDTDEQVQVLRKRAGL